MTPPPLIVYTGGTEGGGSRGMESYREACEAVLEMLKEQEWRLRKCLPPREGQARQRILWELELQLVMKSAVQGELLKELTRAA